MHHQRYSISIFCMLLLSHKTKDIPSAALSSVLKGTKFYNTNLCQSSSLKAHNTTINLKVVHLGKNMFTFVSFYILLILNLMWFSSFKSLHVQFTSFFCHFIKRLIMILCKIHSEVLLVLRKIRFSRNYYSSPGQFTCNSLMIKLLYA